MMIPTATMGQAGVQFILRQQPTQPQVLTIQAPNSGTIAQTTNGKQQIVRYVSQMPQVTQVRTRVLLFHFSFKVK